MSFWDKAKYAAQLAVAPGLRVGKTLYDWNKEPAANQQQRDNLNNQGGMASWFADVGQENYGKTTAEAQQARDYLRGLASGQNSVSSEQLRQGLGQNLAAQRSMAASAAPGSGPMAARTAATQMGRVGAGMSGQAALAGIQERNAAQMALNQAILGARQQDMGVALGSRQNATQAYGGVTPEKSKFEQLMPVLQAGGQAAGAVATMSDRRLKEDIEDGDDDANEAMRSLRSYSFKYKNRKHGEGKQVGIMAQDLEKAGLKHAVMETPEGKAVHGGKLATANTAMLAALEKRVAKIEKGSK
jgi:hypothetical protein